MLATENSPKKCSSCGGPGPFAKDRAKKDGLQKQCDQCRKLTMARYYERSKGKILARCAEYKAGHQEQYRQYDAKTKAANPELYMWLKAKRRAEAKGLPFNIEVSDIVIPERCPLLGIVLQRGKGKVSRCSPTLDRKIPSLGYVRGNVWVISHKANAIKQDASLEEVELLVGNLSNELRKALGDLS